MPGQLEIRDIAGLIKGASSGAGMGNAFLSQIRGVNVGTPSEVGAAGWSEQVLLGLKQRSFGDIF